VRAEFFNRRPQAGPDGEEAADGGKCDGGPGGRAVASRPDCSMQASIPSSMLEWLVRTEKCVPKSYSQKTLSIWA
jgi:hypothetical protein